MDDQLEQVLHAAIRAPSGDNMQPWRFVVDSSTRRIAFYVDETRDPSPMNAGQRMSRIAIGAALENAVRYAQAQGWIVELEAPCPPSVATVRLIERTREGKEAPVAMTTRVTNRRVYDSKPLPAGVLEKLKEQTSEREGVQTHWIVDPERLDRFARLIGGADMLMFGSPSVRRAFLANVRFDAPPDKEVDEGLSLDSLELSRADQLALRMMARTPHWLLKATGAFQFFAAHARKLIKSASGLCLVVAQDGGEQTDIEVGRAVERAWLALCEQNLATQPMCSLIVLANVLEQGSSDLVASLSEKKLNLLDQELRSLAPEIGAGRLAFLFRFGFAPPPTGRTGRLPLEVVCDDANKELGVKK